MAAVGVLARAERLCAAAKARAAAPVEACGSQRATAAWLAQASGTSVREGSAALATASAVEGLAATREAFVAGRLSAAQAAAVVAAAAVDPGCEDRLLAVAATGDLGSLREEARK